jgi:uncharacterized damage-inducible protein DinB
MDPATVAEALRQVLEGEDFYGPRPATSRVKQETANLDLPLSPYSIATNAEHTVFWNKIWLARLNDTKRPDMKKDWRVPEPEEWDRIRKELATTVEEAHKIASSRPFKHKMKSDEAACKTLLAIAVHTAYHLGQISILKRMARNR